MNRKAESRKAHRGKEDMIFYLVHSLNNLVDSIAYLNNINNKYPDKEYKLVIFIEDTSSLIFNNGRKRTIYYPLKIDKIVEAILENKSNVFAVVYCVGNEFSKQLTVIKLETLNEELRNGN